MEKKAFQIIIHEILHVIVYFHRAFWFIYLSEILKTTWPFFKFLRDWILRKLVKLNPPASIYFRYSCTCMYFDTSIIGYKCLYPLCLQKFFLCVCWCDFQLHCLLGKKYTFCFLLNSIASLVWTLNWKFRCILLYFNSIAYVEIKIHKGVSSH